MDYIRTAIYTTLKADASLLALLGDGANSLLGEREATSTTPKPFLVATLNGGRNNVHTGYQTWAIYCEHDKDPLTAANIFKLVKNDLNEQALTVSDGGIACMECQFVSPIPSSFDRLLRLGVEGQLYRIWVRDI